MEDKVQFTRQEIKRLKKINGFLPVDNHEICDAYRARGYQLACDDILKYIDSIPEEHASEDLEEDSSFEKLLQEIYVKYDKKISIESLLDIVSQFVEWQRQKDQEINKLTESTDLYEASWKYSDRDGITYGQRYAMQIDFKAGAEWQKQKMMKDAVDATILDVDAQTIEFGLWPEKLLDIKEGDKVKIIIVKTEQ